MPKHSDDLSALFRSLRPDAAVPQDSHGVTTPDVAQRWPLFKAIAPEKPRDTSPLSALDRQRWVNQEVSAPDGRKPALSLPGLSDKMSQGLARMSARAVRRTAVAGVTVQREPEVTDFAQTAPGAIGGGRAERLQDVGTIPAKEMDAPSKTTTTTKRSILEGPDARVDHALAGFPDRAKHAPASGQPTAERQLLTPVRSDESLKSIFSRFEAKAEAAAKPVGNRSSFMDRLGKR